MKALFTVLTLTVFLLGCSERDGFSDIQSPQLPAPNAEWQQTSMLDSDNAVTAMTLNVNGYLIAGIADGDSYRSKEIGEDWRQIPVSPVAISDLLLLSDGQLLASTFGAGLYTSSDNGLSWSRYLTSPRNSIFTIAEMNDGSIAAASPHGFLIASSLNDEWIEYKEGLPDGLFFLDLLDVGGELFGGSSNGIFRFDGSSWIAEPVTGASQSLVNVNGNLLATTSSGIFLRSNNGWQNVTGNLDGIPINDLAVADNGIIYAATNSGIYRTGSASFNWQPFGLSSRIARVLQYHPQRNMLFAGVERRVFRLALE